MARTFFSFFIESPVVDEWASSTITANRCPATPFVSPSTAAFAAISATTGNFCSVVMMIRAPCPARASRNWSDFWSTRTIVPGVWSSPATVSCSCRSSTRRSVMMMTLSKIG